MNSFVKIVLLVLLGQVVYLAGGTTAQDTLFYMEQNGLPFNGLIANANKTLSFDQVLTSLKNLDLSLGDFKEVFHRVNADSCLKDLSLLSYVSNLSYPQNILALQYIDATSKIPNGILQGRWNWVGDYQECNEIVSVENPLTNQTFKGQYFSVVIDANKKPVFNPYPLVMGVCLPDSCNETVANYVLNAAIKILQSKIAETYPALGNVSLSASLTVADEQRQLDGAAKGMLAVTSVILFVVLISTLVDYLTTETKKQDGSLVVHEDANDTDRTGLLSHDLLSPNIQEGRCGGAKTTVLKLCQAFSIVSNGKKVFSTTTAVGPLACLNGIRVMSMWWVILGHTYAFIFAILDNTAYAGKFIQRFTFQPILNGTFSVDSFFFLSGLLVSYLALNEIREKGKLNWIYYVLHRYWRLTPLYLFVIFYYTFLMTFTVSGPLSFLMKQGPYEDSVDACKKYWWTNILYINNMYPNYGNLGTTCMGWGWYLANDMQFYLVFGPLLIIALSRRRLVGITLGGFLIFAGVAIRASLVAYYGLHGLQGQPSKHVDDPWGKNGPLYGRPYARWSVYLVGMMTGYVLSVTKNKIRIHKGVTLLCWCCAIATGLAVIYGQYYYSHHPNTKMTLIASIFYVSISRTAWGMCLSWVVFACVSGNGGPVKDILSWKFWAPLGRLTYSAYLVHPIVIYTFYFNMRETLHATDLLMVYLFVGHLVISYAVAFIVSMLVEAPMIQLEKLLLKPSGALGIKIMEGANALKESIKNRFSSN